MFLRKLLVIVVPLVLCGLCVFFLPLLLAGLHLAFAFPFVHKLLLLFNLWNTRLLVGTTARSRSRRCSLCR